MFIRKIAGLVLLLFGLSLLLGFVSSLNFNKTGLEGFIGAGPFEKPAGAGSEKWEELKKLPATLTKTTSCNVRKPFNPPQLPVFFVEGLNAYTNHMRLYTSSEYVNGVWVEDRVSYRDKPELVLSPHMTRYKVTPIVPFDGHIPVSKDTCYVSIKAGYNSSTGTYVAKCDKPYFAVSTAHAMKVEKAIGKLAKIEMNGAEFEAIKRLAIRVTEGAKNDYERVLRIEKFLKKNYAYDPEFERAPAGEDPTYWFLFKEKRGVCVQFASAFVIMCNAIGIPARLVVGYLAKPTPINQTVFASQLHAWAEVRFEKGWVEFDPTPSITRIPTITKITNVRERVREGENFTVEGFVKTKDGKPIDGYVEIYLKRNKSDERGILLKLAKFENGRFRVVVRAPKIVGEYYVLAHYVGSLMYASSWSDPIIRIYGAPHFEVRIPPRVSTNLTVKGRLVDYNGTGIPKATVYVKVDGKIYDVVRTDENGNFIAFVRLSRGYHDVELYYPGSKFVLPVSYKKRVEAGDLSVTVANANVEAGKRNEVYVALSFNGKPIANELVGIVIGGKKTYVRTDSRGVLKFEVKPDRVGLIPVEFIVFGYSKLVVLKAISKVRISASYENGKLRVEVRDELGNRLNGTVVVNGKKYELENGVAVVDARGSKFHIVYPGDEFHPKAEIVYEVRPPIWPFLIPIAIGACAYYVWSRRGRIEIIVEREVEGLPLIWKAGEEVRFRVRCRDPYRVFVDGKPFDGSSIRFEEVGEHVIRVERLKGGRVREVKEVRVEVVEDYGKAIARVFEKLVERVERVRKTDLSDATPREVVGMLKPCKAELLLRAFELYKYGRRRGFKRSDFVEAFKDFLEVSKCVR